MSALSPKSSPHASSFAPAPRASQARVRPGLGACVVAGLTAAAMVLSPLPAQATLSVTSFIQDGPSAADIAKAKGLYVQAEELVAQGNHADAVPLYEEAYQLVPGKHGFAYKVGVSAYEVGDCAKAKEYFNHLVTYGSDQEKLADKVAEAKGILGKIKKSKCDQPKKADKGAPQPAAPVQIEEDNPFAKPKPLTGTQKQAKEAVEKSRRRGAKSQKNLEAMKSYGLMGIGGAMMIGGGVLLVLARVNGRRLGDLAKPTEPLELYPQGDFACRNPDDPCPYRMAKNMRIFNLAGYGLLGLGLLAVGGGTYFLLQQRKSRGKTKSEPSPATTFRFSPHWGRQSMGASASMRF